MKVVILTGADLRHAFVRKAIALAAGIDVQRTYCEGVEGGLARIVKAQQTPTGTRLGHLALREASERDFFAALVSLAPDQSRPLFLEEGAINEARYADEIAAVEPDLLAAYGCSVVRDPLLSRFRGRFLNVHLGLSPYYRGSGTNFWPLVEGRPEFVGATFMHMDTGIDAGEVIHQIRATVLPGDTPHQIGNRLIRDMAFAYAEVICQFHALVRMPPLPTPENARVCRKKDFTEESVASMYRGFREGMIESYLAEREARCARVPIIENPSVRPVSAIAGGPPWDSTVTRK